ncbi:MAG: hypothetical protein EBZ69_02190 [Alphaproteobacteria bacterium]|nr:hypothetical protein [Alphaproteobacteria bacterium]
MSYNDSARILPCSQCNGFGSFVMMCDGPMKIEYSALCPICFGTGIHKPDLERAIDDELEAIGTDDIEDAESETDAFG